MDTALLESSDKSEDLDLQVLEEVFELPAIAANPEIKPDFSLITVVLPCSDGVEITCTNKSRHRAWRGMMEYIVEMYPDDFRRIAQTCYEIIGLTHEQYDKLPDCVGKTKNPTELGRSLDDKNIHWQWFDRDLLNKGKYCYASGYYSDAAGFPLIVVWGKV